MEATIPAESVATILELSRGNLTLGPAGARVKWWRSAQIGAGTNAEVDTLFDLPEKAIVHEVLIEVTTAEVTGTTKTLDVGLLASETGGDADGFADGVSVASTGIKRPGATVTTGALAANTRGLLLADYTVGAGDDDRGIYVEKPHVAGAVTAKSVSYSRGSTLTEFRGYIWILYSELPA